MTTNRPARRPRCRRAKLLVISLGVVWASLNVAAGVLLDSRPVFRFPFLVELKRAYAAVEAHAVVGLGSSRALGSFDVTLMTSLLAERMPGRNYVCFSGAVGSSGLVTQEAVLRGLLEAGRPPGLVTVEVAPEFMRTRISYLVANRDVTWSNFHETAWEAARLKYGARLIENRLLPAYSLRFGVRRAAWNFVYDWLGRVPPKLDPMEPDVAVLGTGPREPTPPEPPMTEEWHQYQVRQCQPPIVDFDPTTSGAKALERMLALCEARGVPVLMVEAPACRAQRATREPALERYAAFLRELLRRHPGARYVDFCERLPDTAFKDQHHVTEYGRHLICRQLAESAIPDAFASWERRRPDGGIAQSKADAAAR